MKSKTSAILALLAFILMLTVNILSVVIPINGVTPGEVSDSYPNLFAPAGYTFSIWSVIYLLLLLFVLYQLGAFITGDKKDTLLEKVRFYFIISSIFNAAWIFAWHYNIIPLSLILIVGILICLINIANAIRNAELSPKEYFFIALPFSIYFGWITVATIANVTTLLVSLGWNGFGISEQVWTVIVLFVGAVISILATLKNKSAAYGLTVIWAYTGILLKHLSKNGFDGKYPSVITTVYICLAALAIAVLYVLVSKKEK